MEKLLASINTRLKYITNNSDNSFIHKRCDIINIKLDEIRERKYETYDTVAALCDRIINFDIDLMKRTPDQTNMVYKKMDELAGFVEQIKSKYFEENSSEEVSTDEEEVDE